MLKFLNLFAYMRAFHKRAQNRAQRYKKKNDICKHMPFFFQKTAYFSLIFCSFLRRRCTYSTNRRVQRRPSERR